MRCLLFIGLCLISFSGHSSAIRYEITPLFPENDVPYLQVRVFLSGETDGATEFTIPDRFGPADQLSQCIRNLRCTSASCTLVVNKSMSRFAVHHPANAAVEIQYEVIQDVAGETLTTETAFRPLIRPDFFYILGSALFVTPMFGEGSCAVTLDWRGLPPDWQIHNSFGTGQHVQHFQFSKSRLIESVFMGGHFRVLETRVRNSPVYLAIRGDDWPFSDTQLLEMLQKTVTTQRAFWQDWEIPYFTVTLMPLDLRPVMSAGSQYRSTEYLGTGLRNSFAAFVTPSPDLDVTNLRHLFNHEMMHNWIGNRIRSGGGPNDMRFGWFSEGFTEYFTYKNMLNGGFITPDEYVETMNREFFKRLYSSSLGEEPNSLVSAGFFDSREKSDIVYKRGFVFAFYLDNAIKQSSGGEQGLHQFMLDLLDYYAIRTRDLLSNFDFFEVKLSEYLREESAPLLRQYIQEGKRISPGTYALPDFLKMETDQNGAPFIYLDKTTPGWEEGLRK